MWLKGRTRGLLGGRTVEIREDPYLVWFRGSEPVVKIEGRAVEVGSVRRYRDGGTTVIETDMGEIFVPAPGVDRAPTLDGNELR